MSHTFINLSFEDADPSSLVTLDGEEFEADGWTISEVFTAEEVADFSDGTIRLGTETFEVNWSNTDLDDFPSGLEDATFNSVAFEDFETWPGSAPVLVLAPSEEAVFNSVYSADDFETGWGNDSFLFELGSTEALDASPDGFESGWNNDDFAFDMVNVQLEDAAFYSGSSNFRLREDFEIVADYVWRITLVVSGSSNGLWIVAINGEYASYQALNEGVSEVRTGMINAVSGIDGFQGVAAASGNILYVRADDLPPEVVLDVALENPSSGEKISKLHADAVNWGQTGFLASNPPTF